MLGLNTLKSITAVTRRLITGHPTSAWPEAHVAWMQEQIRAYATLQNYVSPLTAYNDNITGETAEMRMAYRKFLSRPEVKAPLFQKLYSVCSLDPQVISGNKKNPRANAAAAWVDYAISTSGSEGVGGSPGGWVGLLSNVLLMSMVDGFSITNKVFDTLPKSNTKYPGWWTLKAAKAKDTNFLRFRLDQFKNLTSIQAVGQSQGGINFDPKDFIVFTLLSIFESPFGMSDLRAAYRAATLIEGAVKLRAILIENYSGPFLVATSKDSTVRKEIGAKLNDARARGWIAVPDGTEVEVINLATSNIDIFQATIDDYRKEIAISIQGASLQMYEATNAQGQGNSETARKQSDLPTWWASICLAQALTNQLVPDLCDPHFDDSVERPHIKLGGVDPTVALQEAQRFKFYMDLGGTLSREQVADELAIEHPKDLSDELRPVQTPQLGPMNSPFGNNSTTPGTGGSSAAATFRGRTN